MSRAHSQLLITPATSTEVMDTVTMPATSILGMIWALMAAFSSAVVPVDSETSLEMMTVPGKPNSQELPMATDICQL